MDHLYQTKSNCGIGAICFPIGTSYEAESGQLTGNATRSSCSACSGGQVVTNGKQLCSGDFDILSMDPSRKGQQRDYQQYLGDWESTVDFILLYKPRQSVYISLSPTSDFADLEIQ